MATAELKVKIDAETGQLKQGLDKADRDLKNFGQSATKSVKNFGNNATSVFKVAAASIAGALSVGAFVNFGRDVLNATAQFEKFGAVLGNTLGSSALASLKLKEIQEFAAKTPFGVNELTNSFVKLANQGFKPTGDQMRLLGDLASSTGKSFDQLAEAVIDAQVGEFERLKEFGIRAQDAGNKVIFTFKGVQTTVDKSSESIRQYVTDLGKVEGVSGSMAVISETLTGKISNLGDSWDQMLISVGSNTSGVFSSAIDIISKGINGITRFNKELEIQSKFKIGGGFLKRLTTSTEFNPEETFNTKKAVDSIIALDDELTKLVSGVISGAKSVNDFGIAIAKIKAEGDKKLKQTSILGPEAVAGIKDTYQNAIKALQDGRKAFQVELNRPSGANFGKAAKDTKEVSPAQKAELDYQKRLLEIKKEGAAFAGNLEILKINNKVTESINKQTQAQEDFNKGLEEATLIGDLFQAEIFKTTAPLDNLKLNLLPQLQGSFQTFFDEILIRGKLSFDSLGKSILNTFASVLANQATTGVLALLGDKDSKAKGNIFATGAKLLGIGKGAGGDGIASKGLGKILGTALPFAGIALAGASILGGLFKKKSVEPQPAFTTSNAISTSSSSNVDFGSGRVVFEISGVNLVGVLNRAGAKLQRFGP